MTDQEFAELLTITRERFGIECKGPGPLTDRQLLAQVVRAALGMANRRDGGIIIVGMEDNGSVLKPVGIIDTDLATWKFDQVADRIAEYADPYISFELESRFHEGKTYVVINVHEFEEIPVLCKKDYQGILRRGACYVRTRRKPETTEIPSQAEMRDLLDLANEKGVRKFVTQAQAAGLDISGAEPPTDQELYDQQLGDLK